MFGHYPYGYFMEYVIFSKDIEKHFSPDFNKRYIRTTINPAMFSSKNNQHNRLSFRKIYIFAVRKKRLFVAQLVEQLTLNQWVGGSSPPEETISRFGKYFQPAFFILLTFPIFSIMALITENNIIGESLMETARKMVVAARTAPKGRGRNSIEIVIATGGDIKRISDKMIEIGKKNAVDFLIRDANNILLAEAIVLIGTKAMSVGLNCGLCGFKTCAGKDEHPECTCVFNQVDLGIAVGSAVSVAADNRVDNRIMYSIGLATMEMKLLGEEVKMIFGIPLAAYSKNPFFDRK